MTRVIIESPYAGDYASHEAYARACLRDSLSRGEAPFASHVLYPEPGARLEHPGRREQLILAGFAWGAVAEMVAVYIDFGVSEGMLRGIERATLAGQPLEYRKLGQRAPVASYRREDGAPMSLDR